MTRLAIDPSEIRLPDYGARRRLEVATGAQREAVQRVQDLVEENKHLKTMNDGFKEEIGVILEENRALQRQVKATLKAYQVVISRLEGENRRIRRQTRKERSELPFILSKLSSACIKHGIHINTLLDPYARSPAEVSARGWVVYDVCMAFPSARLTAIAKMAFKRDQTSLIRILHRHLAANPGLPPYPQMSTN